MDPAIHGFSLTAGIAYPYVQYFGEAPVHRDLILGHSLRGMDVHYIAPDEDSLKLAMEKYTKWLDDQIAHSLASVDQIVDQK